VLAAGAGVRFGGEKLTAVLPGGERLIDRALRAVAAYRHYLVTSTALLRHIDAGTADIVVNDRPDLGMVHSIAIVEARIPPSHAIVVLPADLALIEPQHVALVVEASSGYDVTYPRNPKDVPGHPVIFSGRARAHIAQLGPGERISAVRDRADLTRRILSIDDAWPYTDVDRISDLASLRSAASSR
jgi:CTP:molybdopterin cytidylyltransferase MocA